MIYTENNRFAYTIKLFYKFKILLMQLQSVKSAILYVYVADQSIGPISVRVIFPTSLKKVNLGKNHVQTFRL